MTSEINKKLQHILVYISLVINTAGSLNSLTSKQMYIYLKTKIFIESKVLVNPQLTMNDIEN